MAEGGREVRVFVSSPGDTRFEQSPRAGDGRLNGEFQGVCMSADPLGDRFYKAHGTFQAQIPESAQCDIVVAISEAGSAPCCRPVFIPCPMANPIRAERPTRC